jgi:hypothetical protein
MGTVLETLLKPLDENLEAFLIDLYWDGLLQLICLLRVVRNKYLIILN